jgi:hypothetical protein
MGERPRQRGNRHDGRELGWFPQGGPSGETAQSKARIIRAMLPVPARKLSRPACSDACICPALRTLLNAKFRLRFQWGKSLAHPVLTGRLRVTGHGGAATVDRSLLELRTSNAQDFRRGKLTVKTDQCTSRNP